jgi:hypothetical protein
MALKVYWTHFSKTQLQNIFLYHKEKANIRVAKKTNFRDNPRGFTTSK